MEPFSSLWFWLMLIAIVLIIVFFVYFDTEQSEETGDVTTPSWAWIVLSIGVAVFFVAFIIYYMVIYKFEMIESHLKNDNKLQIYSIPPNEITGYMDNEDIIWETKIVPIEKKIKVMQDCGTIKEEKELIMAKSYTRVYMKDCNTEPKNILEESIELVDKSIFPNLDIIEKDLNLESEAMPNFLDL